jgi:hypothetical protein
LCPCKDRLVKPLLGARLVCLCAVQENFLKVTDELPVQVLDAPLDLLFAPRKTAVTSADANSRVKPFATSLPASFNADLLERRAEKLNNLLHAQSVLRRLDSYNFAAGLDYGKTTGSKTKEDHLNSLNYCVRLVATKKSRLNCFMMAPLSRYSSTPDKLPCSR